jgi:thiol peroxidase
MAQITLRGNPINTNGELPAVGSKAPEFSLVKTDLSSLDSKDLAGKRVILNIFPSIDTPVCQLSAKAFNSKAGELDNTVVVCTSMDLPFALNRYCGAEGLDQVVPGSAFRSDFASDYGVKMSDGPLAGLTARAVVVIDENGLVKHAELVGEIAEEPDYDAALASLS